jgi:N-acetylglucosamine malate deacetylase 1
VNVLVLAPHPDDESIGPGGTLALHASRGDSVHVLCLTSGESASADPHLPDTREAEVLEAVKRLGVELLPFPRLPDGALASAHGRAVGLVAQHLVELKPERLYLPHESDDHEDHRAVARIVRDAVKQSGISPWALGYEVWSPMPWFDQAEDISSVLDCKLHAIAAHQSQLKQFAYDRSARGLAMFRGALAAKCEAAEVFCSMDIG